MKGTIGSLVRLIVFGSSLSISGCSLSGSQNDPLAEFKVAVARVESNLPAVLDRESNGSKVSKPLAFDVEKTASLVSPFTASMTFTYTKSLSGGTVMSVYTLAADYAYQKDHWVCKRIKVQSDKPIDVCLDVDEPGMSNMTAPLCVLFRDCVAVDSQAAKARADKNEAEASRKAESAEIASKVPEFNRTLDRESNKLNHLQDNSPEWQVVKERTIKELDSIDDWLSHLHESSDATAKLANRTKAIRKFLK